MSTFYEALVAFAVGMTVFYFICLLTPKIKKKKEPWLRPTRMLLLTCLVFLMMFSLTPLLVFMQGPRPLWFFIFLVLTFIVSYVTVNAYQSWKLALLANIIIAATTALSIYSSIGAVGRGSLWLGDGFDAASEFILRDGSFENAWLNEPYFRFFPATSTSYALLSMVSGVNVSTSFLVMGIVQTVLLTVVITLMERFFLSDPNIACLALPFILSSPRLGVWQPHASLLSLLFAALLIYFIVLEFNPAKRGRSDRNFVVLLILLGLSSVVHHTEGSIAITSFIGGLVVFEILHRKLKRHIILNWHHAVRILTLFLVITLAYWANTYAFYSMVPRVMSTFDGIWNFLHTGQPVYAYTPKQTLRSPIEAYCWAVPLAIVTAYALLWFKGLLKKIELSPSKDSYINLILVAICFFSITLVLFSFLAKLATTAASSERYSSAPAYLLMLIASPIIISKMNNRKLTSILVISSLVVLLFIGATSYTWSIDSVIGRTVYYDELIGGKLSNMIDNNTCVYTTNSYLTTHLALNNITFKQGDPKVFDTMMQGKTVLKCDPTSKVTLYVSDPRIMGALGEQEVNVIYMSSSYVAFTPLQ
jgi:hypothetical protein